MGKCIYCFSTEPPLSREHVIPYGLNGELVLQKASCGSCAEMTSKFEMGVMRGALYPIRVAKDFKTRGSHPKKIPLWVEKDNKQTWLDIPIEEYGAAVALPNFTAPAFLEGRKSLGNQKTLIGVNLHREVGMPDNEIKEKYGLKRLGFFFKFEISDFAALVAKTAYSFTVLQYGIDALATNNLLPLITKESNDIDQWFGSENLPTVNENQISIELDEKEDYLLGRVSYFSSVYVVVVGKLK